jgi:hypothetical protein
MLTLAVSFKERVDYRVNLQTSYARMHWTDWAIFIRVPRDCAVRSLAFRNSLDRANADRTLGFRRPPRATELHSQRALTAEAIGILLRQRSGPNGPPQARVRALSSHKTSRGPSERLASSPRGGATRPRIPWRLCLALELGQVA